MPDQPSGADDKPSARLAADYAAEIARARADLIAAGKPSHRTAATMLARQRIADRDDGLTDERPAMGS